MVGTPGAYGRFSRRELYIAERQRLWQRARIVIDDKLMKATLKATGIKTKREAVELCLCTLLRLQQQTELRCRYEWERDLDAMRRR